MVKKTEKAFQSHKAGQWMRKLFSVCIRKISNPKLYISNAIKSMHMLWHTKWVSLSKVGYFIKIAETFSDAKTAQSVQQEQNYESHLSFYSTWNTYITLKQVWSQSKLTENLTVHSYFFRKRRRNCTFALHVLLDVLRLCQLGLRSTDSFEDSKLEATV